MFIIPEVMILKWYNMARNKGDEKLNHLSDCIRERALELSQMKIGTQKT